VSPARSVSGLASRIALALLLLALSVFLAIRPYLGDIEAAKKESFITEVTAKGPVLVKDVRWSLDSMRAYTRLVSKDKTQIELDVPVNATIVVAELSVTPTDRTLLDPFVCDADLRDDRGNIWEADTSGDVYQYPVPTNCSDDDLDLRPGKTVKVAKVFVVPEEAVPHLVGVVVPPLDEMSAEQRVLITR
jgi:hypothetical protein